MREGRGDRGEGRGEGREGEREGGRVKGGKRCTSATFTSPWVNNEEPRVTFGERTPCPPFSKMTKKTAFDGSPNSLSRAGKSHERKAVPVPFTVTSSPVGGSGTATRKMDH